MLDRIADWLLWIAKCSRTLVAVVLTYSGALWLRHRLRRPRILVLAYHRVTPDDEMSSCAFPEMHVSTSHFEKQLAALQRLYRVVPVAELQDILGSGRPLREHVAAVTFDGGYRDNYEHALPILERSGVSASFFLSTGFVDRRRSPWYDRLADVMRAWDQEPQTRRALRRSMPARLAATFESPLPRHRRLQSATVYLDSLPIHERRSILKRLTPAPGACLERTDAVALEWPDVHDMMRRGMGVGAHGVTLTSFTRLTDDEVLRELQRSMNQVGERVGQRVRTIAYPNGKANDDIVRLASESGARMAFTLEPRDNRSTDDPLRLGRRVVHQRTSANVLGRFSRAHFWCEITGAFDVLFKRRASRASSEPVAGRTALDSLDWTGPSDAVRPSGGTAVVWNAGDKRSGHNAARASGSVPAAVARSPHSTSASP